MHTIFDVINHRIVLKFDSNVFIFHLRTKMDSDEEVAAAAMIIAICVENDVRKKKTRKRRKVWVKPWFQKRKSHGFYSQLLNELRVEDFEMYKNYLRMKPENFDEILHFVRYTISKDTTHTRAYCARDQTCDNHSISCNWKHLSRPVFSLSCA